MQIKVSPSILSADFGRLNEEIKSVEDFVDMIHVDVMDGHFVPNITIGAPVVKDLKSKVPINCHLMISDPEKYAGDFVSAGAGRVVFHVEATEDVRGLLEKIRGMGCEAGVSVKPGTPVEGLEEYFDLMDEVLVMTVEPGFGGQKFMGDMMEKVRWLREKGYKGDIGVDGGVNAETGAVCRQAGANLLVAGSYIMKNKDRKGAVLSLRGL
ncbi:MAG: ribulose-phosphate 3-epimerase [Candidatus Peregrinibacteria bacterium]